MCNDSKRIKWCNILINNIVSMILETLVIVELLYWFISFSLSGNLKKKQHSWMELANLYESIFFGEFFNPAHAVTIFINKTRRSRYDQIHTGSEILLVTSTSFLYEMMEKAFLQFVVSYFGRNSNTELHFSLLLEIYKTIIWRNLTIN